MAPELTRTAPSVVFFDVGGTLLRLTTEPSQLFAEILREHGVEADPQALYRSMREVEAAAPQPLDPSLKSEGDYWRAYDRQILVHLGLNPTPEVLDEVAARFAKEVKLVLFPETRETLTAVKARGYRIGVISNASHGILGDLEHNKILSFFEHVVYSQLVRAAKPDRRIFQAALRKFGVEGSQAWHIGDNPQADVLGAAQMGIWPVFVDRGTREAPGDADVVSDLSGIVPLLDEVGVGPS